MYSTLWMTFLLAFVLSLAMTPVAIKLAPKIGAMDIPKDSRRMHTKAMPRFGGLAIFVGTTVSTAVFLLQLDNRIMGILIGGILIYILGIVDDLKNLPAKVKFIGQTIIAVIMYMYGLRIEFISNFFGSGKSELGTILCFIVTIIWIVGITNTVNLTDWTDLRRELRRLHRFASHMLRIFTECTWLPEQCSRLRAAHLDFCRTTFILRRFLWETAGHFIWDSCFRRCRLSGR